ncbi:MAG: hypothetical protein Q8853_02525 [Candidatus Phytoplasma australasiaticum]|nr:hypothetical protein [Candidatus Phytoplasma australasiaticum]
MVVDALSRMTMGSVSHVEGEKKELVKEVHRLARLGVRLNGTSNGGVFVLNASQSSLVVDVKSKQDLDPTIVELKKLVEK